MSGILPLEAVQTPQSCRDDLRVVEAQLLGQRVGEEPAGLGGIVAGHHVWLIESDVGKEGGAHGPAARIATRVREGADGDEGTFPYKAGLLGEFPACRRDRALALVDEPAGQSPAVTVGIGRAHDEKDLAGLLGPAEDHGVTTERGARVVVFVLHDQSLPDRLDDASKNQPNGRTGACRNVTLFERPNDSSPGAASVDLASNRTRIIASMLALYIVWGTTYLGIKVGLESGLPPTLFVGLRLIRAGVILLATAKATGRRIQIGWPDLRVVAIVGLLLLAGGQYGTYLSEMSIPSGLAALVVALLPLWIALAESAFPDMRRPGRLGWLGLVLGFAGLGILVWPRLQGVTSGLGDMTGVVLQILATWLWTAGTVISKRRPTDLDPMVNTAYQMLIAGAFLTVLGSLLGEWQGFTLTPAGFWSFVYLAVIGSCVGFMAFVYALQHLPASKVMTYAYVNPVIAVFAGWAAGRLGLVPDEPVTFTTVLGMVIIVVGVAVAIAAPTLPPRRRSAAQAGESAAEPTPSEA